MMADNVKVAISSDFLTAFARLPRNIQGKVTEFINKFRNDPTSPGINYEKINKGVDKKIYSVRIDDNIAYRSFNYGSVTALENLQDTFSNMDIKVNGNVLSFYSSVDCLLPIASINGMCHMLNVKVGFNEFVLNQGVYIIGKKKIIIK